MVRKLEIYVNSSFRHDIEVAVGLPVSADTFVPDAVSMVHIPDDDGPPVEVPIEASLVDADGGVLSIKRLGTYPAGGRYEIRVDNSVLRPEYRDKFGGIVFSAVGSDRI